MKQTPILYSANETDFSSNGIGVLHEAIRCRVTEELNGLYELEMTYPANGQFLNDISERSIIYAESSEDEGMQPFRVYRVVKSLTGNILIYAQHISYDLSGIPVSPFHLGNDEQWSEVGTAEDAFEKIEENSVITNPFTFSSTVTAEKEMEVKVPMSARSILLGSENSIVKIFGGDFRFDAFSVIHTARRGSNRGFTIRYGVNMTSLNQDQNAEPFYTGIYPYYSDNDGTIEIDGKIIETQDAHSFDRIKVVDLTSEFTEAPWYPSEVEAKAREWLAKNGFGLPQISLDVGFAQLRKSEEYKDLRILEDVNLGDDVQVYFEKINVSSTARVTKTVWDALEHRYVSIHLGDASQSIATTISNLQSTSVKKANESSGSVMAAEERAKRREAEIKELNDVISSGLGMYKITVGGKTYYSDAADLDDATYIITMTSNGFGYTHDWNNGNPTWEGGLDRDGSLIINYLSAHKIKADQIEVGALTAENISAALVVRADSGMFGDLTVTNDFYVGTQIANEVKINGQNDCRFKYVVDSGTSYSVTFGTDILNTPVSGGGSRIIVTVKSYYQTTAPIDIPFQVTLYGETTAGNFSVPVGGTLRANNTSVTLSSIYFEHTVLQVRAFVTPWGASGQVGSGYGVGINSSFMPYDYTTCDLGKGNSRWQDIYLQNTPNILSDRKEKKKIQKLTKKYSDLFDSLKPVRFKMKNGTSDRFHVGLISQDVEESMEKIGISSTDFAGFTKSENKKDGTVSYGLRYEEFIALCIDQIQKLKKRVEELEEKQKGE